MSFLETWRSLSARIRGLNDAAKLDALLRPDVTSTGSASYLSQQCAEIFAELQHFKLIFGNSLPAPALKVLEDASRLHTAPMAGPGVSPDVNKGLTGNSLVHLQAIESALTFSLAGVEQRILSLTERALQHLQRSLIVDETLRERWLEAFERREERIEALGRFTSLVMEYLHSKSTRRARALTSSFLIAFHRM